MGAAKYWRPKKSDSTVQTMGILLALERQLCFLLLRGTMLFLGTGSRKLRTSEKSFERKTWWSRDFRGTHRRSWSLSFELLERLGAVCCAGCSLKLRSYMRNFLYHSWESGMYWTIPQFALAKLLFSFLQWTKRYILSFSSEADRRIKCTGARYMKSIIKNLKSPRFSSLWALWWSQDFWLLANWSSSQLSILPSLVHVLSAPQLQSRHPTLYPRWNSALSSCCLRSWSSTDQASSASKLHLIFSSIFSIFWSHPTLWCVFEVVFKSLILTAGKN